MSVRWLGRRWRDKLNTVVLCRAPPVIYTICEFEFRLIGIALSRKDSGKGLAKYRCQVVRLKCEKQKHDPIAA
jgi:hypothetical protein